MTHRKKSGFQEVELIMDFYWPVAEEQKGKEKRKICQYAQSICLRLIYFPVIVRKKLKRIQFGTGTGNFC